MAIHPSYQDLRLDGPVAEVRQAGDPRRFDTNPAPLDHRHPTHQHPGAGTTQSTAGPPI
jgi:hypothetical protein